MNRAYLVLVVALAYSVSVSLADPIPFKDCGSKGVNVTSFDISGCSKFPCVFTKNSNVTMTLKFTSLSNIPKLTNLVYGIIAGVKVPFPLPEADACTNGITCPVVTGQSYSESMTLPILPAYPAISFYVQFEVQDDNSSDVICALFPAKIQ